MSIDADQLADLLHDALAERFPVPVPEGTGTGPASDSGRTALLFATVGRPVDVSTLHPPEGTPAASAVRWVEQASSEIVDPLPSPGGTFLQGTRHLSREYDAMVRSAGPRRDLPPDLVAVVEARISQARRLLDAASVVPISGPPVPYLPTEVSPADWFDPAGVHWARIELSEHTPPPPPPTTVLVRPHWKWLIAKRATQDWVDLSPTVVAPPVGVDPPTEVVVDPPVDPPTEVVVDPPVDPPPTGPVGGPVERPDFTPPQVLEAFSARVSADDGASGPALRSAGLGARLGRLRVADAAPASRFGALVTESAVAGSDAEGTAQPAAAQVLGFRRDLSRVRLGDVATSAAARARWVEGTGIVPVGHRTLRDRRITDVIAAQPTVLLPALVGEAEPTPVASDGFSVSFDYCWVSLDRIWLDSVLLGTPGWQVPGYEPGSYSAGDLEAAGQAIPAIPIGFVVVKDVTITANWSSADSDLRATAAGLGPFLLADSEFATSEGAATLSIPGMQIIAWMCEVPPVLPPPVAAPTPASAEPAPAEPAVTPSG